MSEPRYAQLATRLLAERPHPPTPTAIGDRAAAVAALERALRRRSRQQQSRGVMLFAAAAVVMLVAGVALWIPRLPPVAQQGTDDNGPRPVAPARPPVVATTEVLRGDGATLVRGDLTRTLEGLRVPLRPHDRLVAGPASLRVNLTTGTALDLGPTGELAVVDLGAIQRFALRAGHIQVYVAKLDAGQRFVIDTDEAELEVRGTRFEVRVLPSGACADGSRTRVNVFEGLVTVRRGNQEAYVPAGTAWPSACKAPSAAPVVAAAAPASPPWSRPARRRAPVAAVRRQAVGDVQGAREVRPASVTRAAPPLAVPRLAPPPSAAPVSPLPLTGDDQAAASSSSTLAAQNDLFAAAMRARRRGNTAKALEYLDALLDRYPLGPLSERAQAERRKLSTGPGDPP